MEIFNWGFATSIEVGIHNGQGFGIFGWWVACG